MTKQEAQAWGKSHPVGTIVQPVLVGSSPPPAEVKSRPFEYFDKWCVCLGENNETWSIESIEDFHSQSDDFFKRVSDSTKSARAELKRLAQSEWERLKGAVLDQIERSADVGKGHIMVYPLSEADWGVHRVSPSTMKKLVVHPDAWWGTVRTTPEFQGMAVVPRGWPTFEVYWADEPPQKIEEFNPMKIPYVEKTT